MGACLGKVDCEGYVLISHQALSRWREYNSPDESAPKKVTRKTKFRLVLDNGEVLTCKTSDYKETTKGIRESIVAVWAAV